MKLKNLLSQNGEIINDDDWYKLSVPKQFEKIIQSIKNKYQSKDDSKWCIVFKKVPTIENLIDLMYTGYHIDELKIGKAKEKESIKKYAKTFFKKEMKIEMNSKDIDKIKDSLDKEADNLRKKIKEEKEKNDINNGEIRKYKEKQKFIKCWIQCCKAFREKTLEYKRGVSLKIE